MTGEDKPWPDKKLILQGWRRLDKNFRPKPGNAAGREQFPPRGSELNIDEQTVFLFHNFIGRHDTTAVKLAIAFFDVPETFLGRADGKQSSKYSFSQTAAAFGAFIGEYIIIPLDLEQGQVVFDQGPGVFQMDGFPRVCRRRFGNFRNFY